MTRFVISAWSHCGDATVMEANVPLLFNGRRMRQLEMRNQVTVLFLKGYQLLPNSYKAELTELGYDVVDAEDLANELEKRVPVLVDALKNWGGIRHLGILRFLVLRRMFENEDIIFIDGDMVLNADLDSMGSALKGCLYFLSGSSCFGSIPAGHDFLTAFEENALLWNDDHDSFNKKFFNFEDVRNVFRFEKIHGSDQALIKVMLDSQVITMGNGYGILMSNGMYPFANWLLLDAPNGELLRYERRGGVDYINDKKVLVSHLSTDTCTYLGGYIFLRDYTGIRDVGVLGRIPLPFYHYENDGMSNLRKFLLSVRSAFGEFKELDRLGGNPFNRTSIIRSFYIDGDFSSICRNGVWHRDNVFA